MSRASASQRRWRSPFYRKMTVLPIHAPENHPVIKASITACLKRGTANYGSVGSTLTLEIELTPGDDVANQVRHWQDLAHRLVNQDLDRQQLQGAPPARPPFVDPAPAPQPAPVQPTVSPLSDPVASSIPVVTCPPKDWPRTGKSIYPWAKKQADSVGLMKWIDAWGKSHDCPGMYQEWSADETAAMVTVLKSRAKS